MKRIEVLALLLASCSAFCQPPPCITPTHRAAIVLTDLMSSGTLWFGYHALGTCGIDTMLCGEDIEAPPPPPTGVFYACWMPVRSGCIPHRFFDYRGYADIDTHRILIQQDVSPGAPTTLLWHSSAITQMCDSAILQDEFGGLLLRSRMHIDSTAVVPFPFINYLMLIRYGQRPTVAVADQSQMPRATMLYQNYPNPLNPSTLIAFELPTSSLVTLSVLDVLGRPVARLANEVMSPGKYQRVFDAREVSSGVYFCQLVTSQCVRTMKMLVVH